MAPFCFEAPLALASSGCHSAILFVTFCFKRKGGLPQKGEIGWRGPHAYDFADPEVKRCCCRCVALQVPC